MIFRICYAFKMSPWEAMEMTVREAVFLLEELKDFEMFEQANKIALAGGDGESFLAKAQAKEAEKTGEYVDAEELEKFIEEEL